MNFRLFVFFMALGFIVGGGLHYFISGENYTNSDTRNVLVVLQIIFGLILAFFYRPSKKNLMKITLTTFALFISIIIGAQQQPKIPTPPVIVAKIALGETVHFENTAVTFISVIEDSRCPKDVDCIWAGQGKVLVAVKTNSTTTEKELIFNGTNFGTERENTLFVSNTKTYVGYRLSPYPVSTLSPDKRNYFLEVYLK